MSSEPTATVTATAHSNRYAVQIEGVTVEFNSTGNYAYVVVGDQGNGWNLKLKTNSMSAARTKVGKQLAVGPHVRAVIVPVTR